MRNKAVLLQGKNIYKDFISGKNSTSVLKGVNITIYEKDFTVIMGSSGAGKSTLLYSLSGMDTITDGEIIYKKQEVSKLKEKEQARLRAKEYGFVFQQANLVSNLSLYENVVVSGVLAGKYKEKEVEQQADEFFEEMEICHVKDHFVSEVSGGEAQRAAIARAIIGNPGILFADEPTGALNRAGSEKVLDIFTRLHEDGQSILMVTHDIHAAVRGNRIIYLEDGTITGELDLGEYIPEECKKREEILGAWLSSLRW
ncbi:Cell division transporter, ATP-binding protein FtsE [Lachnospiraceae bacterium TWA4]|nr:Cell division transporter, ATP-binding protein FtsE [Lachnospiraceae bacterium TWA4]